MWLLINNKHENNNYNKKIKQGALFSVDSTDRQKQITTFVKFFYKTDTFKVIQIRTWKCVRIDLTPFKRFTFL